MTTPALYFLSTLWTLAAVMTAQSGAITELQFSMGVFALAHWLATIAVSMIRHLNGPPSKETEERGRQFSEAMHRGFEGTRK